jgi:hypothetical protein
MKNHDNSTADSPASSKLSRRAIVKGVATTAPAVLSLGSGAALAVTSNLISETSTPGSGDRYYCLKNFSTSINGSPGTTADGKMIIDLGDSPSGDVYSYGKQVYYNNTGGFNDANKVSAESICKQTADGGVFKYKMGGTGSTYQLSMPRGQGVMVSLTAASSFINLSNFRPTSLGG